MPSCRLRVKLEQQRAAGMAVQPARATARRSSSLRARLQPLTRLQDMAGLHLVTVASRLVGERCLAFLTSELTQHTHYQQGNVTGLRRVSEVSYSMQSVHSASKVSTRMVCSSTLSTSSHRSHLTSMHDGQATYTVCTPNLLLVARTCRRLPNVQHILFNVCSLLLIGAICYIQGAPPVIMIT